MEGGGKGELYLKGEAVKDARTARMRGDSNEFTHRSCRELTLCQQAWAFLLGSSLSVR